MSAVLIGLLSDPHGNLSALEAVLGDVDRVRPDLLVCLGDFVGYGSEPNEVVRLLRERCQVCLAGNHDLAALGRLDISNFNPFAAAAVTWTGERLEPEVASFLDGLSSRAQVGSVLLAHASPRDPVEEYVTDPFVAAANFTAADFTEAAVGHTHVPAAFLLAADVVVALDPLPGEEVEAGTARALVNPGGIGQPRDGDPRASWGTWEDERRVFSVRRVEYPIEKEQQAIRAAGLPAVLADRLAEGW